MLVKPTEGELFPEFRYTFTICFPGEGNYYTIIINLEDIDRIKACEKWIPVADHIFNKDKCEAFRFDTEILLHNQWVSYTPEKAEEALKDELNEEMRKQQSGIGQHILSAGDSISMKVSLEEELMRIMRDQNEKKTGR